MKVKMTNKRMIKKNINYIKKLFFYLYFKNILLTQTKQFIKWSPFLANLFIAKKNQPYH